MLAHRTLYDKLWDAHVVSEKPGHPSLIYVDLQLLHDGTYRPAFRMLEEKNLPVAHAERNVGVSDHYIPSTAAWDDASRSPGLHLITGLVDACRKHGIRVFGPQDAHQGIVHVIGPELGLTQPGITLACADSHTTTHGALGALAFVVGTTQVFHALATQCVLQTRARNLRIVIDGRLRPGVTAKDLVLSIIARAGIAAAAGHAIEYSGAAVARMSIEERMTLCNMSAELGARIALVAPDDVTLEYLHGRPFSPKGPAWDSAVNRWRALKSDDDARFDAELRFDADETEPMVTYGTTPAMGMPVTGRIPDPHDIPHATQRRSLETALDYMGLTPGRRAEELPVDLVFIGSCTNSRVSDLRSAAGLLRGRKVAENVRLLVVPGSQTVKREAESEGLDRIFKDAGGEWGIPGCSMCAAMNGEFAGPGKYVASTSNRNFQSRQGPGARTLLVSPLTAAASAIEGHIADPRRFLPS